jgi:hypothetical protein
MTPRLTFMIVVVAATSLLACAHKPRRELDCRERIDDCMDECSQDYKLQDSCYAGCRNITCEGTENETK